MQEVFSTFSASFSEGSNKTEQHKQDVMGLIKHVAQDSLIEFTSTLILLSPSSARSTASSLTEPEGNKVRIHQRRVR